MKALKFSVILEAVDPEKRKIRLKKVKKYADYTAATKPTKKSGFRVRRAEAIVSRDTGKKLKGIKGYQKHLQRLKDEENNA